MSEFTDDTGDTNGRRTARAARPTLMASLRQRSVDAMAIRPGQCVLDVGCGTGTATLALAEAVGVNGVVRGVDYDAAMVAEAQRRARVDHVDSWVFYHQANAAALPWPDGHFDACRSDRVLQRTLDPERAFRELVRVTQAGGRIVVIDGDWATLAIDSGDPDIDARQAYFQATHGVQNALSGQCLSQLFERNGLDDIEVAIQPVFDREAEVMWCWQQSCTLLSDAEGRFASANLVMISGRKVSAVV